MSKISRREFLRVSAAAVGGAVLAACGAKATTTSPEATKAPEVVATEVPKVERPKTWPMPTPPRNRTLKYYW